MQPKNLISKLCYIANYPAARHGDAYYTAPFAIRLLRHPSDLFPEVHFVLPQSAAPETIDAASEGRLDDWPEKSVTLMPAPVNRLWRWLRQWPVLWKSIAAADLVCTLIPDEIGFFTTLICKLQRKPLLLQVIGNWGEAVEFSRPRDAARDLLVRLADFMERFSVRAASLVFTQGSALFEKCMRFNPRATSSAIVTSTISDEHFYLRSVAPMHVPVRLLSVSRLERGKGIHILLEAMRELAARGVSAALCCVGSGPERESLESNVEQDNLAVHFAGHVPFGARLQALYRDADIFVLPTFHEGLPYVILEAMAQSVPIVSTTVGGIPHVLQNGADAILVAPGDVRALAAAIEHLIKIPAEAHQMAESAFHKAAAYRVSAFSQEHRHQIEETFGPIASHPANEETAPAPHNARVFDEAR
jgi:glycosyltransferase involved in cell wall biosynthesis